MLGIYLIYDYFIKIMAIILYLLFIIDYLISTITGAQYCLMSVYTHSCYIDSNLYLWYNDLQKFKSTK